MTYCLNPSCASPQNPDNARFCQQCGGPLDLRGRYRALRPLGQGGFGRTFLAIDTGQPDQTYCVIKQFLPMVQGTAAHTKASQLFVQEAERLRELGQHPQIPNLLDSCEEALQQYLIQEYIDGPTLGAELKTHGPLDPAAILALLQELLPVLEFIHQRQVIHRDIKPDNILRRTQLLPGVPHGLVLVDFGAAKVATHTALARTGTVIGSAGFVAPEQMGGRAVFASDLYSLGVTCVHLMTGVDPFELYSFGDDQWVWLRFLKQPIDRALVQVLDRLMARPLSQRYPSATAALADLAPLKLPSKTVLPSGNAPAVGGGVAGEELTSAVGLDYTELRDLLAIAHWDQADAITCDLMLQAMGKQDSEALTFQQLSEFPCLDLRTLNHLWMSYSDGHLGFGTQLQIWQRHQRGGRSLLDLWHRFCEQVGWLQRQESRVGQRLIGESAHPIWLSRNDAWGRVHKISLDELKQQVPIGFLPFFGSLYTGSSRGGRIFLERLQMCKI